MKILKLVWSLIKFKPHVFIAISVTYSIFFMAPLATSLIIRELFNSIDGVGSLSLSIWFLILLIPITYLLRSLIGILSVLSEFTFVLSTEALLRTNLMSGVLEKPGSDSLPGSSGEAISRFRGDVIEVAWFTNFIAFMFSFLIFGTISTIILYNINPTITMITYIPLVVNIGIVIALRKKLTELRKESRKATGIVVGNIAEIFNSVQAIKVANAEQNIFRHFGQLNENRRKAVVKDRTFSRILRSITQSVSSYSTGILLLLIAGLIQDGTFTIGDYVLFTSLFGWITEVGVTTGELLAWYQRSKVSFDRMYLVINSEVKDVDISNLTKHQEIYVNKPYPTIPAIAANGNVLEKIEIKNLKFIFKDSTNGIDDISFEITQGSFNVITGEVGSGKSTLLKTILGLLPKNSGDIYWNGELIEDVSDFFVPPISSYTSQVPKLFSDTIRNNLLIGLPFNEEKIGNSIKMAILEDDLQTFEDGLDTVIGPKGVKLSGGQKQRLAAARMFFRDSELIVVDDLSSALDVQTEKKLWEQIFDITKFTFLVVSHRKAVLQQADQIILLKDGKLAGKGKLDELLKGNDEMKELWEELVIEPKN